MLKLKGTAVPLGGMAACLPLLNRTLGVLEYLE